MKVKGREGQNHRGLKTNMDSARLFVFFWERRFIWDRKEGCKLNVLPVDELLGVDDISTVLMREKPSREPVYPNHGSQDVLPLVKLPSLVACHFSDVSFVPAKAVAHSLALRAIESRTGRFTLPDTAGDFASPLS